ARQSGRAGSRGVPSRARRRAVPIDAGADAPRARRGTACERPPGHRGRNLAVTLAAAGSRVVLVDADLRGGQIHARFGLAAATARRTRKRHLADGAAKLRRVGAPAIGVILDRGGAHGADAYEESVESLHT